MRPRALFEAAGGEQYGSPCLAAGAEQTAVQTVYGVSEAARRNPDRRPLHNDNVAAIYNEAGAEYAAYADGDPENLFVFNWLHAYADRYVWAVLDAKLSSLRASGASSVSLLDAGCGPGTWLRRLVIRARELGFTAIRARGFDIAEAQIDRVCFQAADLASLPGVNLSFDVADLGAPLPEAAASVDLALCLYSVLSHLPRHALVGFAAEIGRVTSGSFIITVRPIGSVPTLSVASMDKAVHLTRTNLLEALAGHSRCRSQA